MTSCLLEMVAMLAVQAGKVSAWNLASQAGPMVKFVLLVLILISIVCWGTIGFKIYQLWLAKKESAQFLKAFWAGESLEHVSVSTRRLRFSPVCQVFRAGVAELEMVRKGRKRDEDSSLVSLSRSEMGLENVNRALNQAAANEIERLTRFLSFLATTGSTAPFIGLFGTVWGIMTSFQAISPGNAGFEAVSRGVSEALIATAAGLAAAIPAVVAYNYFLSGIRAIQAEMDNFQAEFINIIERHFYHKKKKRPPEARGEGV